LPISVIVSVQFLPYFCNSSSFSIALTGDILCPSSLCQHPSSSGDSQVGRGTQVQSVKSNFSQGNIDNDGIVSATYSNGITTKVAKITLATFANVDGLLNQDEMDTIGEIII
jgi:flagellar hook protein FlgE